MGVQTFAAGAFVRVILLGRRCWLGVEWFGW
jgi:hypothetical protein